MLHKLFMTFVVVPLGVLFVIFAVANRHAVTVSLDPFGSDAPALSATMPLFMLVLLLVGLGVVIGSVATWSNQRKWRRAARQLQAETQSLREERVGESGRTLEDFAEGVAAQMQVADDQRRPTLGEDLRSAGDRAVLPVGPHEPTVPLLSTSVKSRFLTSRSRSLTSPRCPPMLR